MVYFQILSLKTLFLAFYSKSLTIVQLTILQLLTAHDSYYKLSKLIYGLRVKVVLINI